MKKGLFVIAMILFITSCQKDDKGNENKTLTQKKNLIETTWNVTKVHSENGKISGTLPSSDFPITADLTAEGKDYDMKIFFKKDLISSKGSFTLSGKISVGSIFEKPFERKITELPKIKKWKIKNDVIETENGLFIKVTHHSENKMIFTYPITNNFGDLLSSYGIKNGKIQGNIILELTK